MKAAHTFLVTFVQFLVLWVGLCFLKLPTSSQIWSISESFSSLLSTEEIQILWSHQCCEIHALVIVRVNHKGCLQWVAGRGHSSVDKGEWWGYDQCGRVHRNFIHFCQYNVYLQWTGRQLGNDGKNNDDDFKKWIQVWLQKLQKWSCLMGMWVLAATPQESCSQSFSDADVRRGGRVRPNANKGRMDQK